MGRVVVPVQATTDRLNESEYSIKKSVSSVAEKLRQMLSDYANTDLEGVVIDHQYYDKTSQAIGLGVALNQFTERVQNQASSVLSIFDALLKAESKMTQ
ncbi:hypothetical protein ACFL4F_04310 [Candidatus Margulisiibacteriota bacterium]